MHRSNGSYDREKLERKSIHSESKSIVRIVEKETKKRKENIDECVCMRKRQLVAKHIEQFYRIKRVRLLCMSKRYNNSR